MSGFIPGAGARMSGFIPGATVTLSTTIDGVIEAVGDRDTCTVRTASGQVWEMPFGLGAGASTVSIGTPPEPEPAPVIEYDYVEVDCDLPHVSPDDADMLLSAATGAHDKLGHIGPARFCNEELCAAVARVTAPAVASKAW